MEQKSQGSGVRELGLRPEAAVGAIGGREDPVGGIGQREGAEHAGRTPLRLAGEEVANPAGLGFDARPLAAPDREHAG